MRPRPYLSPLTWLFLGAALLLLFLRPPTTHALARDITLTATLDPHSPATNLVNRTRASASGTGHARGNHDAVATGGCLSEVEVTSSEDSGAGSLRQALAELCSGGAIYFSGAMHITLASPLEITRPLVLSGVATGDAPRGIGGGVVLDGAGLGPVLHIADNAGDVTLEWLTITGGKANQWENAGGITVGEDNEVTMRDSRIVGNSGGELGIGGLQNMGTVTLVRSAVTDNTAPGGSGGGASNWNTMIILDSTIARNEAGYDGGGIYSEGPLTISNSTLSDNRALEGGAIYGWNSPITVIHSTISGNRSALRELDGMLYGYGGALFLYGGELTLARSIVAGNWQEGLQDGLDGATLVVDDCYAAPDDGEVPPATMHDGGYNVVGEGGDCPSGEATSRTVAPESVVATLLGPLGANGGPTETQPLLPESVALDTIPVPECSIESDQRGIPRPKGSGCDSGAFEREGALAVTVTNLAAEHEGKAIRLRWETLSEIDTLGFHLWRGIGEERSAARRVTGEMIPSGAPGSALGAAYEWRDEGVEDGVTYYYWLEEITPGGASRYYGPAVARPAQPSALVLDSIVARGPGAPREVLLLLLLFGVGLCRLGAWRYLIIRPAWV